MSFLKSSELVNIILVSSANIIMSVVANSALLYHRHIFFIYNYCTLKLNDKREGQKLQILYMHYIFNYVSVSETNIPVLLHICT
jgi:hypothetical protein